MAKKPQLRELQKPINPYTDSRKAANKKYMDSLSRVAVWLTQEEKSDLVDRADKEGKSVNAYIRNMLGYKDTPKQATTSEIVLSGGLDEQKLIAFCKERDCIYKSYELATSYDKDEVQTGGAIWAEDERGNRFPIPLTVEELESLRIDATNQ